MKKLGLSKFKVKCNRAGLKLKKHSPEILMVAGVVGTVTSAVMACKATTKLNDILDEAKENIDTIKHYTEHPEELPEEYTEEDGKKDLTIVYTQTGVKLIKLYGPSVVLGVLSLTGIIASHKILRKRNVALAAAYATERKLFKEYRGRVVERFGDKIDKELRYNIKAKEIEETITDENGEEKTVTTVVNVVDPNTISDYARLWYEGNPGWTKDPEANLTYLKGQQRYANEKLKIQGHLFLNEVYDMLGYDRTAAGGTVGWIYDTKNPNGDNFVDFGIYDGDEARNLFVNAKERSILLDFNVDGPILDLI